MLMSPGWQPCLHFLPINIWETDDQEHEDRKRHFVEFVLVLQRTYFPQPLPCKSFNILPPKWHHFMAHWNDVIATCWREKVLFHCAPSRKPWYCSSLCHLQKLRKNDDFLLFTDLWLELDRIIIFLQIGNADGLLNLLYVIVSQCFVSY